MADLPRPWRCHNPRKYLMLYAALSIVVLTFLTFGLIITFYKKQKNCGDVLYEPLKDQIQKDYFNEFTSGFKNVWVGKRLFMTTKCSYFTMRADGSAVTGYYDRSPDPHNTYHRFVQGSEGIIHIYSTDPESTRSVFPIFAKDFVLGNIFCDDNEGKPQWVPVVSVQVNKTSDKDRKGLVDQAVKVFKDLEANKGLDLGLGEYYDRTCYEEPKWGE